MTDTYTKEFIKAKLENNNEWLVHGIVAIFKKQTESEQESEETTHRNDVGFRATDAKFLSGVAKFIINNRKLSEKQIFVARKKMIKYAGQLAKIANKEI